MSNFEVKAILTAKDNMTGTMNTALGKLGALGSKVASGLGFGVLMAVGQSCFNAISSSVSELATEMSDSTKTWKTFEGNMKMLGKSGGEIDTLRKDFQKYAQQTIYSSSDMASTYSQLAAVGTKSADTLVKGFAGLAASAIEPKQAMKTLSQQAVQMAGRPKVAWQDFKLMLEQAPAGIAAVAKEMGKTTSELTNDIQAGKVATSDFFDAIEKVGNSTAFQDMATQYQTLDQAMDGLKETVSNKLLPTYQMFSEKGISAIEKVISYVEGIDGDALAEQVSGWIKKAGPILDELKTSFADFAEGVKIAAPYLQQFGGYILDNSDKIAQFIHVLELLNPAFLSISKGQESLGFIQSVGDKFTDAKAKVTGFLEGVTHIPTIFKTQFGASLIEAQNWGTSVVETVKTAITNFVNAIVDGAKETPTLLYNAIAGAVSRVSAWGGRLSSAASRAVKQMVSSAVSAAKGIGSKFVSIGADIVNGVIRGISGSIVRLYNYIYNAMSGLVSKAKKALKIESPSRVFASEVGRWIPEGIAVGIDKYSSSAVNSLRELSNEMLGAVSVPQLGLAGASYGMSLSSGYSYDSTGTYTIEVPVEVDGRQIAKATATYTQAELTKNSQRNQRKRGVL